MTMPTEAELQELTTNEVLAHLLAGLQVPLSIDGRMMLGAGYLPYREMLRRANLGGWALAEDFSDWLASA